MTGEELFQILRRMPPSDLKKKVVIDVRGEIKPLVEVTTGSLYPDHLRLS